MSLFWLSILFPGTPGNDTQYASGLDGNNRITQYSGSGDDTAMIYGGDDDDTITYHVWDGEDQVWINGGSGGDMLMINAKWPNFTVYDEWGNIIYKQGEDGPAITFIDVEHITVIGLRGEILFEM